VTAFADIAAYTRAGWVCDLPATLDDVLERMLVAACEANRLARLEYRWVERFRLWERGSPELAAKGRALAERRRDAVRIAEDADWELGPLWNRWSRALPPISVPAVRLAARSLLRGLACTVGRQWRHDQADRPLQ
jgi:hypothetical protein